MSVAHRFVRGGQGAGNPVHYEILVHLLNYGPANINSLLLVLNWPQQRSYRENLRRILWRMRASGLIGYEWPMYWIEAGANANLVSLPRDSRWPGLIRFGDEHRNAVMDYLAQHGSVSRVGVRVLVCGDPSRRSPAETFVRLLIRDGLIRRLDGYRHVYALTEQMARRYETAAWRVSLLRQWRTRYRGLTEMPDTERMRWCRYLASNFGFEADALFNTFDPANDDYCPSTILQFIQQKIKSNPTHEQFDRVR